MVNKMKAPEEKTAFEHANQAILLGMEGNIEASVEEWGKAVEIAECYFPDNDFYFWIYSGYGSSLYENKRYYDSIQASLKSRPWTLENNQPISSLTLAHAFLALKDLSAATPYIQEVYTIIGEGIFEQFEELNKDELISLIGK